MFILSYPGERLKSFTRDTYIDKLTKVYYETMHGEEVVIVEYVGHFHEDCLEGDPNEWYRIGDKFEGVIVVKMPITYKQAEVEFVGSVRGGIICISEENKPIEEYKKIEIPPIRFKGRYKQTLGSVTCYGALDVVRNTILEEFKKTSSGPVSYLKLDSVETSYVASVKGVERKVDSVVVDQSWCNGYDKEITDAQVRITVMVEWQEGDHLPF